MSTLYEVKAEKVDGVVALLDVRVVHPDAMWIPADTSFALMMLREASKDGDALSSEVAFEDTLDEAWMTKFGKGFVRDVAVTDMKNEGKSGMRARVRVTVTHPAWIAHLKAGLAWSSTAFDVVRSYDPHEPIAPASKEDVADDEDDAMFVWVPRECFMFSDFGFDVPPLLRMPAYAASCYGAGERWKRGDAPSAWVASPVLVDARAGVVGSIKDDWAMILEVTHGSRGSFGVAPSVLARLAPKAGRRGTKLTYAELLRAAATSVSAVDTNGDTIELTIRIPPDGRTLPFETETDAFQILFAPLEPRMGGIGAFVPSALTDAIIADLAERDMEGSHRVRDIRAEIAKKYVRSFTLVRPALYTVPNLDALAPKAAHDVLAGPWPTAKLRIVVSDPKWIAHLDVSSYRSRAVEERPLEPPREPAPKVAPAPVVRSDARAVLWFNAGTSDKVWVAERTGKVLATRYGRRRDKRRSEKNEVSKDAAAAIASFDKAVAKKTHEGYRAPFTTAEAIAYVKKRFGVVVDDASGELVIVAVEDWIAASGLRPKDVIENLMAPAGETFLHVVEELAIAAIDIPAGTTVFLNYRRPSSRIYTGASLKLR